MFSLLLVVIYAAFISLGLPDSLIGSAWPVMHGQLHVPVSYAGVATMIIAGGTIVSSLFSDRLIRRFGAGLVTAASVLTTAIALFGFSFSPNFVVLCLWAVPYGLGAGAVDAALNNYVALHYKSRQMNWLHCFWGVGAAISPAIMGGFLVRNNNWQGGYRAVGYLQIGLTIVLFLSLPLWQLNRPRPKVAPTNADAPTKMTTAAEPRLSLPQILRMPGVVTALVAFFAYCSLEGTTGLWASSYLVQAKGVAPDVAARFASLFFIGITVGRFFSGLVADRWGDHQLVRVGISILLLGVFLLILPVQATQLSLIGLVVIGLGCAPIYPAIIHATPMNFGAENSQAIIGVQMASAYVGSTFMPPLFGVLASTFSIGLYPVYLLIFALILLVMTEWLSQQVLHKAWD
ncbi:MFS transporter [Lapidilactobacillus achengensis]|uniref:MFS transporter n=1 Tax=Lapidilactobacillus achengensis TaxID=2486000 RepID=A0ABW1USN3_9LACO|nr:MFS transporter [Lapidilactobacillus achengensis]